MSIKFQDMELTEIVFTHIDPITSMTTDIAVSRLAESRKVKLLPVVEIPVTEEWATYCLENRGIEQHRLERLKHVIGEFDHILHIHWGDGSKLQIDGVHRYVASWLMGRKTIKTKIIPVTAWRPFIVTGMEQEIKHSDKLRDSFSGIL